MSPCLDVGTDPVTPYAVSQKGPLVLIYGILIIGVMAFFVAAASFFGLNF